MDVARQRNPRLVRRMHPNIVPGLYFHLRDPQSSRSIGEIHLPTKLGPRDLGLLSVICSL